MNWKTLCAINHWRFCFILFPFTLSCSQFKMNFDVYEKNCSYIVGANGSGKRFNLQLGNIFVIFQCNFCFNQYWPWRKWPFKRTREECPRLYKRGRRRCTNSNSSYKRRTKCHSWIRQYVKYLLVLKILTDYFRIIVERRISQKSSQFILKSRSGNREQILHKKNIKHELDLILQQFNIELDNPLSWLSQDRARQFLQSMKPEKLYEVILANI